MRHLLVHTSKANERRDEALTAIKLEGQVNTRIEKKFVREIQLFILFITLQGHSVERTPPKILPQ